MVIPCLKNGAYKIERILHGGKNDAFAQYFAGQSYLNMLSATQAGIGNVTFEPGCRNNWHIHHASKGGGQILLVTAGRGYYQEWVKRKGNCIPKEYEKLK
ncbi:MAG TPA: hypothetical protein H9717_15045 [Candidatus Eisenbergiella merdipullorum]|uniref:Cupin domain-containing protein n=1 Tax=Candidatus Eisenbergiella merdipullorum TaxID=2838553 RepID=A0A9D2I9L5_9FIRM|nr:hypothetical protein [Candidatus Eisenbergiella merdipullorum]